MKRRDFILTTGVAAGLGAARTANAEARRPVSDDDPLGVRGDFPITRDFAYLNTAYTGAVPAQVAEVGVEFAREKAYGPASLPEMMERVERARATVARMFEVTAEEIGFLFATSEGENIIAHALDFKTGDNVVIDELHYTTTYVLYRHLEKSAGLELRIVPTREGSAKIEDFERLTNHRTRLISVSWVSHDNGYRHDIKALADIAHAHGAYIYVDAVQAAGMFPMDLRAENVDFLASGGYKWLHASYNSAGFYVRRELLDLIPPDRMGYLHLKSLPDFRYEHDPSARKYEFAAPAFSGIFQMERAIDYLSGIGFDRIEAHVVPLANYLNAGLRALGFDVLTPPGNASGIVTFAHRRDPGELQTRLDAARIEVTNREVTNRRAERHVRISVAVHTNRAEVDRLLDVLRGFA